jgi:hypothetical protein
VRKRWTWRLWLFVRRAQAQILVGRREFHRFELKRKVDFSRLIMCGSLL